MAAITVKVDNGRVYQSLRNVGDAIPRITDKAVKNAMTAARDEVRTYPPERPGQRYRRTGKRYRATQVVKVGLRAYRLESNPVYKGGRTANPYVIGDAFGKGQAWMHAGRWKLLYPTVKRWIAPLLTEIEMSLSQLLRREGLGL